MEPLTLGFFGLGAIFILVVLGMRIAFATALVGLAGIWIMKNMIKVRLSAENNPNP